MTKKDFIAKLETEKIEGEIFDVQVTRTQPSRFDIIFTSKVEENKVFTGNLGVSENPESEIATANLLVPGKALMFQEFQGGSNTAILQIDADRFYYTMNKLLSISDIG